MRTLMHKVAFAGIAVAALMAADSATAAATPKAEKVKTVADDMDARRVFESPEKAIEYLNVLAATISDFKEIPLAFAGGDSDGDFDPEVYKDDGSVHVMVGVLRNVGKGGGSSVKCIYVLPIPSLDSLLSDDAGTAWVEKIILKELSHVGVRALRPAEDISTVVDQMPTTRDAYISTSREGAGGIMESFNELYKVLNATMAKNSQLWAKFKLPKVELKRALESKAYAEEFYPALENRGDKDSLFVSCLKLAKAGAAQKALDPTIFDRWLETRDQKALAAIQDDEESFDIDALTGEMLAEPEAKADADAATTAETVTA